MYTIEANGRPIMTIAAVQEELEVGWLSDPDGRALLDNEGSIFADMVMLAGVPENAELTWRDAFEEERDAWTLAAHFAVKEGDFQDLDDAREGNFAVWLVPVSGPDLDDDDE